MNTRWPHSDNTFTPANAAAQWTNGLLVANVVLDAVGIAAGLLQFGLLTRAATGGISDAEAAANDARQQIIGILALLVYLGTVVSFLVWFYRVHRNLPALGARDLKYTPGWAVGGFFVPFLNLIRPLQVMREIWHGSDPRGLERDMAPAEPSVRKQLGTPALIGWWWALWLFCGFLSNRALLMSFSQNPTLVDLQSRTLLMVLSDLFEIPAAILAVSLVVRITGWQAQRAERIQEIGSQPPTPPLPSAGSDS
jgi:hypothetical protein